MLPTDLTTIILDFSQSRDTDWFIEEICSHIENSTKTERCYLKGGLTLPFYPLDYRRQIIMKSAFSKYDFDKDELSSLDEVLDAMLEKF